MWGEWRDELLGSVVLAHACGSVREHWSSAWRHALSAASAAAWAGGAWLTVVLFGRLHEAERTGITDAPTNGKEGKKMMAAVEIHKTK